ncbi:hypothetical protein ABIB25_001523 [Nakamurella sp. UYEF19]|uniref:hypothetical protein n=1 Tax=Nakamurella sp. UYEF19 TaxID=1756392 RepID=UPI003393946C
MTTEAAPAQDSPPSEAPSTEASTTTSTSSAKNVLGPDGYLGVELGESQPTAKLDAVFASTPAVTTSCTSWDTIAAAPISSVLMSAKLGIAGISPRSASSMQTPEGMTAGWTATQVHAAYPTFRLGDTHEEDGGPEIAVPQNAKAVYKVRFDSSDKVVGFSLLLRNQDCFG